MIYRLVISTILLAAIAAAVLISDEGSAPPPVSTPASVDPDASAMKSLRIE